jgi:hypothetical protein
MKAPKDVKLLTSPLTESPIWVLLEEVLTALLDILFHPFAAVENDVDLFLGVEALEIELRLEAYELVAFLDALDVGLGCGEETAEAVSEVDLETALDLLVDHVPSTARWSLKALETVLQ